MEESLTKTKNEINRVNEENADLKNKVNELQKLLEKSENKKSGPGGKLVEVDEDESEKVKQKRQNIIKHSKLHEMDGEIEWYPRKGITWLNHDNFLTISDKQSVI